MIGVESLSAPGERTPGLSKDLARCSKGKEGEAVCQASAMECDSSQQSKQTSLCSYFGSFVKKVGQKRRNEIEQGSLQSVLVLNK